MMIDKVLPVLLIISGMLNGWLAAEYLVSRARVSTLDELKANARRTEQILRDIDVACGFRPKEEYPPPPRQIPDPWRKRQ